MARSVDAVFIGRFAECDKRGVGRPRRGVDLSEVCPAPGRHVIDIRLNDDDVEALLSQGIDVGLRAGDELRVCGGPDAVADSDEARIVFLPRPQDDLILVRGGFVLSIHVSSPMVRDIAIVAARDPKASADVSAGREPAVRPAPGGDAIPTPLDLDRASTAGRASSRQAVPALPTCREDR